MLATWSLAARVLGPAIIVALAVAAYWSHGVRERRAGREDGRAEVLARWTADVNESNRRAALAGDRYTRWQTRQAPKVITRTVEVSRALESDPWSAQRIPDGLRDTIERAAADTGAGEPDHAVPSVPATDFADAR
jgi:hypothetical protein